MNKLLTSILAGLILIAPTAQAQDAAVPSLPAPLENYISEGAQVRYLGNDHGLDAWLTIKNGVQQYYYVLPDKSAFLMGLLYDKDGKVVTVRQVQRLRSSGDKLLDDLAEIPIEEQKKETFEVKSPSERLFADVEESNWVPLGEANAPVVYSFIDPQCPHCHAFINDVISAEAIQQGKIQLRLVPIGFKEETRAQAAFLIATPNPQERWLRHMAGEEDALPARSDINQQGVQRNLAIMQAWKFDATPMIVYRAKDGAVKIIRGRPDDLNALLSDIGG